MRVCTCACVRVRVCAADTNCRAAARRAGGSRARAARPARATPTPAQAPCYCPTACDIKKKEKILATILYYTIVYSLWDEQIALHRNWQANNTKSSYDKLLFKQNIDTYRIFQN